MDTDTWRILCLFVAAILATLWLLSPGPRAFEGFITLGGTVAGLSLSDMTTQALDAAPSTSEVKDKYRTLLLFCWADIKQQGTKGLRILADFRDRLFSPDGSPRSFRADLTENDFVNPWPTWIAPLDTTINDPVPQVADAVAAEAGMLAYLQKNFPQESTVDEQTGATIRNLIEDFGYRFVFQRGVETVQLKPDFMKTPLLKNWSNPVTAPGN